MPAGVTDNLSTACARRAAVQAGLRDYGHGVPRGTPVTFVDAPARSDQVECDRAAGRAQDEVDEPCLRPVCTSGLVAPLPSQP